MKRANSSSQGVNITKWFLVALSVYMLADSFLWNGFNSIIYPKGVKELVPADQLSLVMGVTAFVGVMIGTTVGIISGTISDKATFKMGRRRPFMIVGAVMAAASLMLVRYAQDFTLLFTGFVLLQISENIATGAYFGLLPDLVPTEKTGLASGVISLFQFIGSLLGFVGIGYLVGTGNTDLALLSAIAVILGSMILTVFAIKEQPVERKDQAPEDEGIVKSLRKLPKDLVVLTSSRFFALLGTNVLNFFSLYYVSDVLGAQNPEFLVAALGAAVLIVAMLSGIPAGLFSDKIGRKALTIVACILGAVAMVAMAFVSSVVGLIVAGSLLGACMGVYMTTSLALSSDLSPPGMGGATMGLSNLAMGWSQAVSSGIAGLILQLTRDIPGSAMGYRPVFLFAALCFVVGIALVLKVKEKIQQPKPQ